MASLMPVTAQRRSKGLASIFWRRGTVNRSPALPIGVNSAPFIGDSDRSMTQGVCGDGREVDELHPQAGKEFARHLRSRESVPTAGYAAALFGTLLDRAPTRTPFETLRVGGSSWPTG